MGRGKDKYNDPARRLDRQKSISNRKEANLNRLQKSIRIDKPYTNRLTGEMIKLKPVTREIPTYDSQGFQILRPPPDHVKSVWEEQKRALLRCDFSNFSKEPPYWMKFDCNTYFLFEFACGYALFECHGLNEIMSTRYKPYSDQFKVYEEYIKSPDLFTLKAFHPFSSTADALVQMNAISNSTLSQQLKIFLADNLPNRLNCNTGYFVSTPDIFLGVNIKRALGMFTKGGMQGDNLTRSLRMNIEKFIDGLVLKDVEKAQHNLARLYCRQMCTTTYVESSMDISSSSLQRVMVVPHRFEGVFIAKGKEDFICTRNLVPGEALYGEEVIFVQNEGGTEVEYKLWNPRRSTLANAIKCGVTNIWVKPGSRILYLGDDACPITISHLSDLVGSDGLVYVVGLSDVAVNMAKKRLNVITVFEKPSARAWKYRMLIGMVDVIYADIVSSYEVHTLCNNALFYLRAGGHYMVYTRVNNIYSTSRGKDPFATLCQKMEFTPIEVVMLEPIHRAYAMAIGGFRMLE